jgi:hypothetical protein
MDADAAIEIYHERGLDGLIKVHSEKPFECLPRLFTLSCTNNYLEMAKWVYSLGFIDGNTQIDIHVWNESIFTCVCIHGYLDMAHWLYSLGFIDNNIEIDIHVTN